MPINHLYEDPEAIASATVGAYGMATSRLNKLKSIDNQLQADQANANLGLGYDQLEAHMAQQELNRQAQLADSQSGREFQAGQAATEDQAALDRIQAAGEQQQQNTVADLSARQKMQLKQLDGALARLDSEKAQGLWRNRDADFNKARQQIEEQATGIKRAPAPFGQQPPPGLLDGLKAQGRYEKRADGTELIMQPDGNVTHIMPPKDPVAVQKSKDEADRLKAAEDAKAKEHDAIYKSAVDLMGKTIKGEDDYDKPRYDSAEKAAEDAIKIYKAIQAGLAPPPQVTAPSAAQQGGASLLSQIPLGDPNWRPSQADPAITQQQAEQLRAAGLSFPGDTPAATAPQPLQGDAGQANAAPEATQPPQVDPAAVAKEAEDAKRISDSEALFRQYGKDRKAWPKEVNNKFLKMWGLRHPIDPNAKIQLSGSSPLK